MIEVQGVLINELDYAIRGNAILGIRDSGKTYSATFMAEQLMKAGIPIVAYDPIGVWRWLQVGRPGFSGYPVVVAGDNGDLPLTADNAVRIVHAAMKNNVSLVLDLYSMNLSKAQWRSIVEQSVELLLNDNKQYGVRHIFLEEASEFVPQRVRPEYGRVYSAIEKLVRMGGNASLGITLINQRAEELNKAVLELCDCLLLHRQKGKNSLTSLGKWLDIANIQNPTAIVKSLPLLDKGQCWIWDEGSMLPAMVQMPEKETVHPDRRSPEVKNAKINVDVSGFVAQMKKTLEANKPIVVTPKSEIKKKKPANEILDADSGYIPAEREQELLAEIESLRGQLSQAVVKASDAEARLGKVRATLLPQYEGLKSLFEDVGLSSSQTIQSDDNGHWQLWLEKFGGQQRLMLELMISRRHLTRQQLRMLAGVKNIKSFGTFVGNLKRARLIAEEGDQLILLDV